MTRLHRALGALAAVWLSCQLAAAVLTPIVFWASSPDVHLAECTCVHGTDAACPMHHKPAQGLRACAMQGTSDQATVLLTSLFGAVALMPGSTPLIDCAPSGTVAINEHQMTAKCAVAPDPPPPRA